MKPIGMPAELPPFRGPLPRAASPGMRKAWAATAAIAEIDPGPLQRNTVNLMGQSFGKLTVVGRAPSQHQATTWRCRCSCGRLADYRADLLRAGRRVSCGCADPSNKIPMVGRSFGQLEVLGQAPGPQGAKEAHYLCQCACGGETVIRGGHLRSGHTTSCGCEKRANQFGER
jgi:hypothetical protein